MSSAWREPIGVEAFLGWEEQQPARYEFDGLQPVALQRNLIATRTTSDA